MKYIINLKIKLFLVKYGFIIWFHKKTKGFFLFDHSVKLRIIQLLLNENEKYMLKRAVDDRVEMLERTKIKEKWVNPDLMEEDVKFYKNFRRVLSTKNWK